MATETRESENYNIDEEFTEKDPLKQNDQIIRNYREMCFEGFKNITIEPIIFLFVNSCIITMITTQNLNLEKACRVNMNQSIVICQSLKNQDVEVQNEFERDSQKLLATAMASRTYITATLPCILSLFVGSWSDKTGHRKFFIIFPIIGQMLLCLNNMLNVYFFDQLSMEVLVFSEAILEGFSGGWCILLLTCFAYISAITTDRSRTFRIGLASFCLTVGFPMGMGLSGITLKKTGYYGSYGLAAFFHTLNILYTTLILKNPERSEKQKEHDGQGICHFFRTFFDFANVKDTMMVMWKKTENNRRFRLCVMMIIVSFLFGPMYGEMSIMYMTTRYRFNWDEVKFSIFQTYNFITHTIGTIFSILVFSKYLQWHDSILGIISTTSKIAASFVYCFASNEKIFFIAPLVEILNGTSFLALRSLISKSVTPQELGKVNSIFALTENLMPLVYVPLYTKVYTSTMEVLPGAVFLMGASMTLPALLVFIWLFYHHRKQVRRSKLEKIRTEESTQLTQLSLPTSN